MSNVCCDRMGMDKAGIWNRQIREIRERRNGDFWALACLAYFAVSTPFLHLLGLAVTISRVRRRLRQDVQDKQDGFAIRNPSRKGAALMGLPIDPDYPVNLVNPVRLLFRFDRHGQWRAVGGARLPSGYLKPDQTTSGQLKADQSHSLYMYAHGQKSPFHLWPMRQSKLGTRHWPLAYGSVPVTVDNAVSWLPCNGFVTTL